ncbi:hypothetical protein AM593_10712, partial [Mytilus galloprovincialis]
MVICLGGITAYTTFVVTLLSFCLFLIHTFISLDIEERIFHSSNDTSNSTVRGRSETCKNKGKESRLSNLTNGNLSSNDDVPVHGYGSYDFNYEVQNC